MTERTAERSAAARAVADNDLERLCRLVRRYIVRSTSAAGSGHVTSSFSAVELTVALYFHRLRYDLERPEHPNNDRVIFSKGHASPLFYALYAAAGAIGADELDGFRTLESKLEGHPRPNFRYAEAATGSLGQGLSIGLGMALNARRLDELPYVTWVLLGDGELAEGSVWEAVEVAPRYGLGNLVALADVNRLGQSGPTMLEHQMDVYRRRFEAFGWRAVVLDGHDLEALCTALDAVDGQSDTPTVILAQTYKGRGVSFLENQEGWHGKALSKEDAAKALAEIGEADDTPGVIAAPEDRKPKERKAGKLEPIRYEKGKEIATRKAYGAALARLGTARPEIVALDGDVKNSTYSEQFLEQHPGRFFEMYIAEQNMVGAAVGLGARGKVPFVSTFAAFLSRAYDQIRMAVYSYANVKFVGSHCGVSIGEDGPSQMGLEDLAMFRALGDSVVLYPSDAVSTEKLVEQLAEHRGIGYLRTSRPATPVIYDAGEDFPIGGSKVVRRSKDDRIVLVGAGITLHLCLAAAEKLAASGTAARVIDLYSVRPLDRDGLAHAARECGGRLLTVEDHWPAGGIGEAVAAAFAADDAVRVRSLAVQGLPGSAPGEETLKQAGIDADAITRAAREFVAEK